MRVRLRELMLRDFRGFRGEHRIVFTDGLNIIHGPVGAGKTSIVQAVEYALYGTQLEVKERIAKLTDLINEESNNAVVKLSLSNDMTITRELRRVGDTAREYSKLLIGSSPYSDDVDRRIIEALGIDDDDFERFILITHRTLEALVYGSTARRSLLIDKLFGLEVLENLNRALPMTQIERTINDLRQRLASIKELPEITSKYGSVERARERMVFLRNEVERLRREEEELSARYEELLKRRSEILSNVKGVEEVYMEYIATRIRREAIESELRRAGVDVNERELKLKIERLRDSLVNKLEEFALIRESEELGKLVITVNNLPEALDLIYNTFKKLEELRDELARNSEELTKVKSELELQLEGIKATIRELEVRLSQEEPRVREYRELVSKYGEPGKVKRDIDELRLRLDKLNTQENFRVSLLNVLQYIISTNEHTCPVCGRELSAEDYEKIRNKISEISRGFSDEIKEISNRLNELESALTRMEALAPIVNDYESTVERLRDAKSQYEGVISRLDNIDKALRDMSRRAQALFMFVDEFRARVDEVDKALSYLKKQRMLEELRRKEEELRNKLSGLGLDTKQITELEEEVNYVGNKLNSVRAQLNEYSTELSRLELILARVGLDKEEPSEMRRRLDYLEDLYNRLVRIRSGIRNVQARVRDEMIKLVGNNVSSIFKVLYPYNDLEGAGIEVTVRDRGVVGVVSEYTLHAFRPGGRKVLISRLSDGQRLTLALSFILSVYKAMNHNVDFLLMDEPVPYIDENIRRAFANLLVKFIKEGLIGQVIITTQSTELANNIVSAAENEGLSYNLIRIIKGVNERRIEQEAH
ncbi:AAA family ATPase [Vulcanisaeta thermophila]|uniref:AAA family ATPase n=1 Tax=Vulcanisaeta thermophila TaxID=867917 RepID=UPI001EE2E387|nr:SMC family ATPase [Vulcanisaeta thermophila]